MNKKVSFFENTFSTPGEPITVQEILDQIKNGQYRLQIAKLRSTSKEKYPTEYGNLKKALPAVSFSGVFSEKRKADNLKEYSGVIVFDIDNVLRDEISGILARLRELPIIYASWISPSGAGIKFLVITDSSAAEHKLYFYILSVFIKDKVGVQVDISGSDISRLCFVSFDEDLLINENAEVVDSKFIQEIDKQQHAGTYPAYEDIIKSTNKTPLERKEKTPSSHNLGRGKNKVIDRIILAELIKYLRRFKKSITYDYEHWYKTALAISSTFSYDVGRKYFLELCRLDGSKHDEEKSERLFEYCFANNLDKFTIKTIVHFATMAGFDLGKTVFKKKAVEK
jgi:hypothetical protein